MEFCIVASNYRTKTQQVHVFLDNAVTRFADRGITCNVIAPQSVVRYFFKRNERRDFVSERKTASGNTYTVYSPLYLVFPPKKIFGLHLADLTMKSYTSAVKHTYKKRKMNADAVYAHFIKAGIAAVKLAGQIKKPSFIANGEADTADSLKNISRKIVRETLENVSGIISVSTENKEETESLCEGDGAIKKKITVIPNAADQSVFKPLDRETCREKLGFPKDAFIVSFTGSFIERKGAGRLSRAIDKIDGAYGVFIGRGDDGPTCKNLLFAGRTDNSNIPEYLCASDVFCLPTLAEGCSNAVVEAVSCGIPIVSSDLPFNYDILDASCALLIDPTDVNEIAAALLRLKEDKSLRERLAEGCREKRKELSLESRVDKILSFMKEAGKI